MKFEFYYLSSYLVVWFTRLTNRCGSIRNDFYLDFNFNQSLLSLRKAKLKNIKIYLNKLIKMEVYKINIKTTWSHRVLQIIIAIPCNSKQSKVTNTDSHYILYILTVLINCRQCLSTLTPSTPPLICQGVWFHKPSSLCLSVSCF